MATNRIAVGDEIVTSSEEETRLAGAALASSLQGKARVVLTGPLGSGKTRFAAGFLRALGCKQPVGSPSFTLVHEYTTAALPAFHLDFYRLNNPAEVWGLGWEDLLAEGSVLVEWGERFPEVFPRDTLQVIFSALGETQRKLEVRDFHNQSDL